MDMEEEYQDLVTAIKTIREELECVLTTLHEQVIWKGETVSIDDLSYLREVWSMSGPELEKRFREVALIEGRVVVAESRSRNFGPI